MTKAVLYTHSTREVVLLDDICHARSTAERLANAQFARYTDTALSAPRTEHTTPNTRVMIGRTATGNKYVIRATITAF